MIKVLPFKYVNALTDIQNRTIYVSSNIRDEDIHDVMCDEFGHILSGSSKHDDKWKSACEDFYGFIPSHDNMFDESKILCDTNFGSNIGNVTGIQNLLLDYHLLQAYRKFSQRVLSTEGSWEVTGNEKIRLKPTPKGSFPVVVRYMPSIDHFKTPQSKELASRMMIAESKIMIGHTRRKLQVPGPDGSSMAMDGESLVGEGTKEKEEVTKLAIDQGEPLGFIIK